MQLTYTNGIFNCICSYAEKDYPKSAGFIWDKITPKTWATKDASLAYKFIKYATPEAMKAISVYMEKATANMEASRAKDADIKLPCPANLSYLPFQKAGVSFICKQLGIVEGGQSNPTPLSGVILADEMGLG